MFFSPSVVESPLSLLLFKFIEVSISSGCSSSGCCFFLFLLAFIGIGASLFGVVVTVDVLIGDDLMVFFFANVVAVVNDDDYVFKGDFFFQVTWFQSSSLLGGPQFPYHL